MGVRLAIGVLLMLVTESRPSYAQEPGKLSPAEKARALLPVLRAEAAKISDPLQRWERQSELALLMVGRSTPIAIELLYDARLTALRILGDSQLPLPGGRIGIEGFISELRGWYLEKLGDPEKTAQIADELAYGLDERRKLGNGAHPVKKSKEYVSDLRQRAIDLAMEPEIAGLPARVTDADFSTQALSVEVRIRRLPPGLRRDQELKRLAELIIEDAEARARAPVKDSWPELEQLEAERQEFERKRGTSLPERSQTPKIENGGLTTTGVSRPLRSVRI